MIVPIGAEIAKEKANLYLAGDQLPSLVIKDQSSYNITILIQNRLH